MNDKPSNPWIDGLVAVALLLLLPLGALTALGLLVAMAFGADLKGGPEISGQAAAVFLLAVIAVLVFVLLMAGRWDSRHRANRKG